MSYFRHIEFVVWKDEVLDERGWAEADSGREATPEEIAKHVRIKVLRPGYAEIETDPGFSIGMEAGGYD